MNLYNVYFASKGTGPQTVQIEAQNSTGAKALAEPWYLTFNASVEFKVVMTQDDLQKAGLDEIGRRWA